MKNDPNGFKYKDPVRIYDNGNFVIGSIQNVDNGIVQVELEGELFCFEDSDDVKIAYEENSGWFWTVDLERIKDK